ncbi:DUF2487 family protein [Paenibacillus ginsengarvi]|uniref:DUF2487 family protein n=1 Tax=Paenibacillus ginsengarvi TaxID=400777 RepID=A0A3B0BIM2_9BACL|nr:DUF2487 family protein [Paenibacillus ginsengarvi]RKN72454.1 DUF2487 family protein [Paenibacillus ginsengarvi]
MKFSDIAKSDWEGLSPYLDTCLLPVTGLTGFEQPWEATQELEFLRDVMDCIEVPYKGRIVTYPAFHYTDSPEGASAVNTVCQRLKSGSFRYVILISANSSVMTADYPDADLLLCPESAEGDTESGDAFRVRIASEVRSIWQKAAVSNAKTD